jgi:hypothetical protein
MQACHVTESFFSAVFMQLQQLNHFSSDVSVRREQCDSGKRISTMQASLEPKRTPVTWAAQTRRTNKGDAACLLHPTGFSTGSDNSPSSGNIEDFRFPFPIDPALALRIHIPPVSINIGNWWRNRSSFYTFPPFKFWAPLPKASSRRCAALVSNPFRSLFVTCFVSNPEFSRLPLLFPVIMRRYMSRSSVSSPAKLCLHADFISQELLVRSSI